ncbi:MAG: alpha/beta hydrolase [FCB group bacterium]|nr:alpha/beta hydrolase [FCB group bacterium]
MFVNILIAVALIYIVILILVYALQSNMVFFPSRKLYATPQAAGLAFDNVTIQTEDGVSIHGWFVPADSARGTLLFCHGNAGNISNRIESIAQFNRLGLNVFIFDYRGYGQSEGKTTEDGTYLDADAAWQYLTLTRGIEPQQIIVFGRSLGGAIAAQLATQTNPKILIVESAFTSLPDAGAKHYPFLPVRLMARFKFNTKEYLTRINVPVLIIHSSVDDIIPFEFGQRLFEAAHEPKQFLEINGSHNDGYMVSADQYEAGVTAFLDTYLKQKK